MTAKSFEGFQNDVMRQIAEDGASTFAVLKADIVKAEESNVRAILAYRRSLERPGRPGVFAPAKS